MRRRILVVEDDLTLRQVLSFSLGQEGYEAVGASEGSSNSDRSMLSRSRKPTAVVPSGDMATGPKPGRFLE